MFRRKYILLGLMALIFTFLLISGSIALSNMPDQSIGGTSQDDQTISTGINIDFNSFIDAGCFVDGYNLDCSNLGLDQRFGCIWISNASAALGNLSPTLSLVECHIRSEDYDFNSSEGIVREGCMMPMYRRFIAMQDEEFKLISTKEEFKSLFAPVETKEEALSFAVALTSSFPKYDVSAPEGYFPVASPIKPTYVEETDGGFKVHLFDYDVCGCGTHPYYAIDYSVTRAGNVTELSRQKVYDSNMTICFD
jgi:hypothetical protein